ncbi:MAG: hypothetical protein ACRD2E_11990 [Terriglobales bacterium]
MAMHGAMISRAMGLLLLALGGPPRTTPNRPRSAFPQRQFTARMRTASPTLSPVAMSIQRSGRWLRVRLPRQAVLWFNVARRRAYRLSAGACVSAPFRPPPGLDPFLWRGHIRRKLVGRAMLRGQPVRIVQITIRRGRRPPRVFTAWSAPALGGLPLRVQLVVRPGEPIQVDYFNVQLTAPAAQLPLACRARSIPSAPQASPARLGGALRSIQTIPAAR